MNRTAAFYGLLALVSTQACGARIAAEDVTLPVDDRVTEIHEDATMHADLVGLPMDVPADRPQPTTSALMFVFDSLSIDMTDNPDVPHTGFNLDSLYSDDVDLGGCTHPDYYSLFDNDQHCLTRTEVCSASPNPGCAPTTPGCRGGVDNQMPTLANTISTAANVDVRVEIQNAVATNRFAVLVRVTGVDDLNNDTAVRASMYVAYPTFSTGCSTVAPGREYAIAASSLTPGASDVDSGALISGTGSIVNGRLQFDAEMPDASIPIPMVWFNGARSNVPLRRIRFRASVAAGALAQGSLGGIASGEDVIASVATVAPEYGAVIRGVIGGLIDVQVMGACGGSGETPPQLGAVGLGYGVHAVSASLSTTTPILNSAAPGTCGAM